MDTWGPTDVTWHPVSRALVKARLVTALIAGAPPAAAVVALLWLVFGPVGGGIAVVVVLVVAGWAAWAVPRQVAAWGYAERDEELLVRSGILVRQLVTVPYGRMQFVDVASGPIQRWCGIATVQLHTAAATTDARIPGLPPAEAERLRDRLTARGEAQAAGL